MFYYFFMMLTNNEENQQKKIRKNRIRTILCINYPNKNLTEQKNYVFLVFHVMNILKDEINYIWIEKILARKNSNIFSKTAPTNDNFH